jgi:predicted O-linked N-acetylglucosamine transferase (SPINDLY family)
MSTIPEILAIGLQHHRAGRLEQAEVLYRQILQVAPDHPDALHYLGLIAHQVGQRDAAIRYLKQAIASNSHSAGIQNSIGVAYRAKGKLEEAAAHLRQALALNPAFADAHNNLGNVLKEQGRLEEAMGHYRQALALRPEYAEAHNNLGSALKELGRLEEAASRYRQALALKPAFADAYSNLGAVLAAQGLLEEAVGHYRQALALRPDHVEARTNLGIALKAQGQFEAAVGHYRQALALRPDYAEAHNNLGNTLRDLGHLEAAVGHYRQALALRAEYAEAYNNLGVALQDQGRLKDAMAQFRQALALRPAFADAYYNLANALRAQGDLAEAATHYRHVLALKPDHAESENQLMHQLQHLCEWENLDALVTRQRSLLRMTPSAKIPPFTILSIPTSPAEQLLSARNWVANCLTAIGHLREGLGFHFPRTAKPRIRVGYLSADFRQHPVASLMAELFDLHDRVCFEVVAYSYGPDDGSAIRKRIIRTCDQFVDIRAAAFTEAARRIHADGVDILVDLMGYTQGARTQIPALRPAPIQVNYLGYPGTLGAEFMDYLITDRFITPPDQAPFFAEQLVYLPDCYQVNDRQRTIAEQVPSRTACGLPDPGFVFACFNNTYKITPAVFDVWMRLLQRVPGSVLWLLAANPSVVTNLRREAQAREVAPARLVFAPRVAHADHLARLCLADLFLDTLPVNAHATCSDALWAGLPVLTSAGETFISRVAGSLLRAIGLPELIIHSLEEYEAVGLRLAQHPAELEGIRERLAKNRLTAPLFDTPRFTRHLETAYQFMWEIYLRGEPPRQIEVPALPNPVHPEPSMGIP